MARPLSSERRPPLKHNPLDAIPNLHPMPPVTGSVRNRLAAYTVMTGLGLLGQLYLPDDDLYFLPEFLFVGGAALLAGWLYGEWDRYSALRILRRLDREQQDFVLGFMQTSQSRTAFRAQLEDQTDDTGALAETFPPQPEVVAVANGVFWAAVAADATLLAVGAAFAHTTGALVLVGVVGGALATGTYLAHRWNRLLEPVREISAYGFAETYPDGRRRFLPWKAAGWIRGRRLPQRLEIVARDGRGRVSLPFDSVRFYRACERLMAVCPSEGDDSTANGV